MKFVLAVFLISLVSVSLALESEQTVDQQVQDLTRVVQTLNSTAADLKNQLAQILDQLNKLASQASQVTNYARTVVDGVDLSDYLYKESIVYDKIFDAYTKGIFEKKGTPVGWDEVSWAKTPWNGLFILKIGAGVNNPPNGIRVIVPPGGYNVLWVRVLNDRWETFRIQPESPPNNLLKNEIYACGWRGGNAMSPDGAAPDFMARIHFWCPMPLRWPGNYYLYSEINSDDWISGIAFSKNLWNHAANAAVAYHWNLNGGTTVEWNTHDWFGEVLAQFPERKISKFYVPVVHSGRDKLLYIVEHNNIWLGVMHGTVTVNGQNVERFRTSFSNPWSTHFSSKFYNRYIATIVPAALIQPNDQFLEVTIDLSNSDAKIYFREIGTHDYQLKV